MTVSVTINNTALDWIQSCCCFTFINFQMGTHLFFFFEFSFGIQNHHKSISARMRHHHRRWQFTAQACISTRNPRRAKDFPLLSTTTLIMSFARECESSWRKKCSTTPILKLGCIQTATRRNCTPSLFHFPRSCIPRNTVDWVYPATPCLMRSTNWFFGKKFTEMETRTCWYVK